MAKIATFTDNFSTTKDTTLWNWGTQPTVSGGKAHFAPTNYVDSDTTSATTYDLTSSSIVFKFDAVQSTANGNGPFFDFILHDDPDFDGVGNRIFWHYEPTGAGTGNMVARTINAAGTQSDGTTTPAWSSGTPYYRILDNGTSIIWATSPDGTTWTNKRTLARPSGFTLTAMYVTLRASNDVSNSGTFDVDAVNPTAGTTQAASAALPITANRTASVSGITQSASAALPITAARAVAATGGTSAIASLIDDFTTKSTSRWTWGPNASQAASRAAFAAVDYSNDASIISTSAYGLLGSSIDVEFIDTPNTKNGDGPFFYPLILSNTTDIFSGNRLMWAFTSTGVGTGTLVPRFVIGAGADNDGTALTWSSTDHRYLRIRETSGTTYWETSPDRVTWTVQRSLANPFTISTMYVSIRSANSVANTGAFLIGGVNTASGGSGGGSAPKAATLVDGFDTKSLTLWNWGSEATQGSSAALFAPDDYLNSYVTSAIAYDLTSSAIAFNFSGVQTTAAGNGPFFDIILHSTSDFTAGNRVVWHYEPVSAGVGNMVPRTITAAGTVSDGTPFSYSATTTDFLRVRDDGTNLIWEYSPDGATWTTARSIARPFTLSSMFVTLRGTNDVANSGSFSISGVNPSAVSLEAPTALAIQPLDSALALSWTASAGTAPEGYTVTWNPLANTASVPGGPVLKVKSKTSDSITVTWTPPTSNGGAKIVNYKLYAFNSAGTSAAEFNPEYVATVGQVVRTFTFTNMAAGVTYRLGVAAVNRAGTGTKVTLNSATTGVVTPPTPGTPLAPASVTFAGLTQAGNTFNARVLWTAASDAAQITGYTVSWGGWPNPLVSQLPGTARNSDGIDPAGLSNFPANSTIPVTVYAWIGNVMGPGKTANLVTPVITAPPPSASGLPNPLRGAYHMTHITTPYNDASLARYNFFFHSFAHGNANTGNIPDVDSSAEGIEHTYAGMKAHIDALDAETPSRKVVLSIGGAQDDTQCTLATELQMFNSLVVLIDKYGFKGIDFDLESAANYTADGLRAVSGRLKAKYGANFCITCAPGPGNDVYTAFATTPTNWVNPNTNTVVFNGILCDAIMPQFYDWPATDAQRKSDMSNEVTRLFNAGVPYSRIVIGGALPWGSYLGYDCNTCPFNGSMQGGNAAQVFVDEYNALKNSGKTLRGMFIWDTGHDLNPGGLHTAGDAGHIAATGSWKFRDALWTLLPNP